MNTTVNQAQAVVHVEEKGRGDQEPLSFESMSQMLRETMRMVNRLRTVLITSVKDGLIRREFSAQAGASGAATEHGTGAHVARATSTGLKLDYRPGTTGLLGQSSTP